MAIVFAENGSNQDLPKIKLFQEILPYVYVENSIIFSEDADGKKIQIGSKTFDSDTTTLFRHTPFSWLYHIVRTKDLTFISPERWSDPFEKLFYDKSLAVNNQFVNGCLCFTYIRNAGEDGMWKNYKDDKNEPLVKMDFNFMDLMKQLSLMMVDLGGNASIYITLVDYSYDRKDILSLYKKIGKKYASIEEYLTCLSIKRKAFDNENEVRIFLISDNQDFDTTMHTFDVDSCIKRVTIQPLPFLYQDCRSSYYHNLQDIYHEGMKNWMKMNMKGQVHQSHLYDNI